MTELSGRGIETIPMRDEFETICGPDVIMTEEELDDAA